MTETTIIKDYLAAREKYYEADDTMRKHFSGKVRESIEKATSLTDLQAVKENLRTMPDSAGKVLIFREILMKEELIKAAK